MRPTDLSGRPADEESRRGPAGRALSASVHGNSIAFGFSITVTASFAVLNRLEGSPTLLEILLFAIAAATAVAFLEGIVTRGFRRRAVTVPSEVYMLGTALNLASVAVGIGVAIGLGELLRGTAAWPVASFAASAGFVLAESAETMLAERIQHMRGDPDADVEERA